MTEIKELIERLRKIKDSGDIYKFAAATGIAPASVSAWIYGRNMPNYDSLVKLAAYFEEEIIIKSPIQ